MKKFISSSLIILLFFMMSFKAFGQVSTKMKIKIVSKNLIVANMGKSQGIQVNEIFNINREGKIIGKAKVLLIEDNLCGLKVLQLQPGCFVKSGDILIKNSNENRKGYKKGYIFRRPKFEFCVNGRIGVTEKMTI